MRLAIHNFWVFNPTLRLKLSAKMMEISTKLAVLAAVVSWSALAGNPSDPTALVRQQFREAEARYSSQKTNSEAAWQFARACFDLGEIATNSPARAEVAERGIAASRPAV